MRILCFVLYNLLILSLNIFFVIFLLLGFAFSDPELSESEVFISNLIFLIFYILMYFTKLAFFPITLFLWKKNRYLRYLYVRISRGKKYSKRLLLKAFLFDYLLLLGFALFIPGNIILKLIFAPLFILPWFYLFGGGVFISYAGLILWTAFKKRQLVGLEKSCISTD